MIEWNQRLMSSRFESGCSLPKLSFIQFNTLRAPISKVSLLDFAFWFAPLMCSSCYAPAPSKKTPARLSLTRAQSSNQTPAKGASRKTSKKTDAAGALCSFRCFFASLLVRYSGLTLLWLWSSWGENSSHCPILSLILCSLFNWVGYLRHGATERYKILSQF